MQTALANGVKRLEKGRAVPGKAACVRGDRHGKRIGNRRVSARKQSGKLIRNRLLSVTQEAVRYFSAQV
ncbi:hypothetical protein AV540_07210 [Brevibacillus parabrevis]|nr:hypothetical protein AV540_07210 [Brevibacillus parabrevis]